MSSEKEDIPSIKIHHYYRKTGKSIPIANKQKKKYYGELIHGDGHRTKE